ncbi:PRC-barrel domain-containing protein [Mesorhizobium sp. IMUNJ 23232]|uniref:PRC-barrel domain-containing protein n=1 Tax=Mesorhizobium sp. IMUNJ 23232 TaxID=3376064 RepID=UPI0037A48956
MRFPILAATLIIGASTLAHAKTKLVDIDDEVVVHPFNLTADAIEEMNVLDTRGNKIGEIEEALGPTKQRATAVAVDLVDGSGLRDDDEDIIVPLDALILQDSGSLVLNADAKTIKKYEVFSD